MQLATLALAFVVPVAAIMSAAQFQFGERTLTGESANAVPISYTTTSTVACFFTCHPPPDSGSPSTPTLQSPANAAGVADDTPTLTALYSDPEGSYGYLTFEICTTSNCNGGGQPIQTGNSASGSSGTSKSWTPSTPLTVGTTYYWQAMATDNAGNTSGFSAIRSFTVTASANVAPSSPSTLQQYRSDGSTVIASGATTSDGISTNLVLRFSVSDPDANQTLTPWVEYRSGATAFSGTCGTAVAGAVVSGANITTTTAGASYTATVNITGLATGTNYRWRACVRDAAGSASGWIAKGANPDFVTASGSPPTAPTLVSPTGGGWVGSRTPTLTAQFGDPNGGDTGQLQFELCRTNPADPWTSNCASEFQSGVSASGIAIGATGAWAPNAQVAENTLYYWRARATDDSGFTGPWATSTSFRADATPPTRPANVRPDTRGLGAVKIVWDASTDTGVGGITYDVQWSLDGSTWQDGCMNVVTTECQQGGLGGQALVYFRVIACDSLDNCSDAVATNESVGSGYYLRTVTPTYWSQLLTDTANRIVTETSSAMLTTTVADFRNTTGWYLLSPGATNASRQSVSEPASNPWAPTGSGWVVDSFRGLAIDDGPIQVVAKTNSTASAAVAYLQARAWRVTTDGAGTITSSVFLGKSTTTGDVADGVAGVSRTLDINSPGIAQPVTLGANESIYVELWLNVASGAGGADLSISTDDTSSYVVLPPAGPPPNVPTLQSPATSTLVGLSPQLTANYTHPTPAFGYVECQVSTNGTFTAVVDQGSSATVASGTNTTYDVNATLAEGTNHWWRCRARDVFGRASAWSAAWQFITDTRPNTPTNLFPADGATSTLSPTLTASAFADPNAGAFHTASEWQLRSATGSYAFPVSQSGTTSSSLGTWTVPTTLTDGAVYYWRVRYRDEFDVWSSWSSETSFTAQAAPPPNAAPSSPGALQQYRSDGTTVLAVGAWNDSDTVRFSVTASDPNPNSYLTAWVQVKTGGGFNGTCGEAGANVFGGAATSAPTANTPVTLTVTASGLTNGASYQWRVCVQDQLGATSSWVTFGNNPDFRIDSVDPAVALATPLDGVATSDTTPTLTATYTDPAPGTTGQLDLRIGTSPTCGTSVVQSGTSAAGIASGGTGSWTPTALANGTWWWCARAIDEAGNVSPWSPTRELVIGSATLTLTVNSSSVAISPALLSAGLDGSATTTVSVQTNNAAGYTLQATDSSDTDGMTQAAVDTVPDWTGTNASPTTWTSGTAGYFGLSVLSASGGKDTARWGSSALATDYANLRYVGLRTTPTQLHARATFSTATDTVQTGYRVNFSTAELPGSYEAAVTYTLVANP